MRLALPLFGYALALAWLAPAPLARLTAPGRDPRLGLAAWLAAMTSVLAAAAAALAFLIRAAVAGWNGLAEVVCRSVAGHACAQTVYQSAAFELILAAVAVVAALAAAVLAWRYGRSVQRARRQTRAHGEVARIVGRALSTGRPGRRTATVVIDGAAPVAYCVWGRPATIVLSSAALEVLDPDQLGAVLAHERAHLAGRHHLLIALIRGLDTAFPGVPLFGRGLDHVTRLSEMCADDVAARRSGRPALAGALLAMATGAVVPAAALGAMSCAVSTRLGRLAEVPRRAGDLRYGVALAALMVALALGPVLVALAASRA
ncbi:MAG TPA: M56 family metallopeptidase [Streptosporangiaceae bacterium]|nr:M56 family metallopeptidase [Streptosporangiaceae bacterium]